MRGQAVRLVALRLAWLVVALGSVAQAQNKIPGGQRIPGPVAPHHSKTPYPNDARIQSEMARIEVERKPLFGDDHLVTRNPVNVFPNIAAPPPGQIDIEALAKRYETQAVARGSADDLLVFASFSMPIASLKALVASVSRVGGSVVLRGFKNNSYRETVNAIAALGEASASVAVNPNAFEKYRITSVPVVLLAKMTAAEPLDADGCALPDNYAAIAGDVSLAYALQQISTRAPQFRAVAERYLRLTDAKGARP